MFSDHIEVKLNELSDIEESGGYQELLNVSIADNNLVFVRVLITDYVDEIDGDDAINTALHHNNLTAFKILVDTFGLNESIMLTVSCYASTYNDPDFLALLLEEYALKRHVAKKILEDLIFIEDIQFSIVENTLRKYQFGYEDILEVVLKFHNMVVLKHFVKDLDPALITIENGSKLIECLEAMILKGTCMDTFDNMQHAKNTTECVNLLLKYFRPRIIEWDYWIDMRESKGSII